MQRDTTVPDQSPAYARDCTQGWRAPRNIHVRGYKEEGTTTTPFDMVMLNDLDRFHLVMDVIDRVPSLGSAAATLRQEMSDARFAARAYTREHGEDDPAITGWTWPERR